MEYTHAYKRGCVKRETDSVETKCVVLTNHNDHPSTVTGCLLAECRVLLLLQRHLLRGLIGVSPSACLSHSLVRIVLLESLRARNALQEIDKVSEIGAIRGGKQPNQRSLNLLLGSASSQFGSASVLVLARLGVWREDATAPAVLAGADDRASDSLREGADDGLEVLRVDFAPVAVDAVDVIEQPCEISSVDVTTGRANRVEDVYELLRFYARGVVVRACRHGLQCPDKLTASDLLEGGRELRQRVAVLGDHLEQEAADSSVAFVVGLHGRRNGTIGPDSVAASNVGKTQGKRCGSQCRIRVVSVELNQAHRVDKVPNVVGERGGVNITARTGALDLTSDLDGRIRIERRSDGCAVRICGNGSLVPSCSIAHHHLWGEPQEIAAIVAWREAACINETLRLSCRRRGSGLRCRLLLREPLPLLGKPLLLLGKSLLGEKPSTLCCGSAGGRFGTLRSKERVLARLKPGECWLVESALRWNGRHLSVVFCFSFVGYALFFRDFFTSIALLECKTASRTYSCACASVCMYVHKTNREKKGGEKLYAKYELLLLFERRREGSKGNETEKKQSRAEQS